MTELNSLCRISSKNSPPSPCHYRPETISKDRQTTCTSYRKSKRKYIERGPHFLCCRLIFWLQSTLPPSAFTSHSPYTVKKVSNILAGDVKIANFFLQCSYLLVFSLTAFLFKVMGEDGGRHDKKCVGLFQYITFMMNVIASVRS
jgi:hypothetical protein